MTPNEIRRRFPNASASCLAANAHRAQLPAPVLELHPEPVATGPDASQARSAGRTRVSIESRRCRLCDPDNLSVKAILDAMRYEGLILDDSPDHIELVVKQTRVPHRHLEQTIVTLEAI